MITAAHYYFLQIQLTPDFILASTSITDLHLNSFCIWFHRNFVYCF